MSYLTTVNIITLLLGTPSRETRPTESIRWHAAILTVEIFATVYLQASWQQNKSAISVFWWVKTWANLTLEFRTFRPSILIIIIKYCIAFTLYNNTNLITFMIPFWKKTRTHFMQRETSKRSGREAAFFHSTLNNRYYHFKFWTLFYNFNYFPTINIKHKFSANCRLLPHIEETSSNVGCPEI